MAELFPEPINKSYLSNNKFDFVLDRLPNFTYFVQSVTLPGLILESSSVPSPYTKLSVPGNQLNFNPVSLTFLVDEDMKAWYELYNWIVQLGNPVSIDKRGNLKGIAGSNLNIVSDATLFIKSNSNNPKWKVTFTDMFPTDMGELTFSTTEGQEFMTCTATFNYTYYEFSTV